MRHEGVVKGVLTDATPRTLAVSEPRHDCDELGLEDGERGRTELELLASCEQTHCLSARLEAVREEERKRIALELHDELGQLLTALKMDVSLLRTHLAADPVVIGKVEEMRELVERTIDFMRHLASQLRPAALNFGLAPALEWLAEDFSHHTQIPCHFHIEGAEPICAEPRATAIFRIAQESLTNVARHAGASRADVTLVSTETGIELSICDDGRGFNIVAARVGHSYGLQGMAERARLIDARLYIRSEPDSGSVVRLCVQGNSDTSS
jgi:signal transduction histidine kinase